MNITHRLGNCTRLSLIDCTLCLLVMVCYNMVTTSSPPSIQYMGPWSHAMTPGVDDIPIPSLSIGPCQDSGQIGGPFRHSRSMSDKIGDPEMYGLSSLGTRSPMAVVNRKPLGYPPGWL